ncbi:site-specific DNA-methyltransferase, partial [Corynebacterium sanguinis]|nr:site-specific DNA-methyltransferase [Corynebacterium sanguinis]
DTFNRFTRPRLEKVINGEDQGGITLQKQERVDGTEEGLPEGLSPEDAQKFNSALNKVLAANPELKTEAVVKSLKTATKTKNQKGVVNWRGGGGFTVAHLAPQCFDYVPELNLVTLTEAATGSTLVNSVAANLNFALTPDNRHFDGRRGSMFLKVVEGRLDREKVEELLTHLGEGEGATLVATELEPGVRQFARTTDKPCQ